VWRFKVRFVAALVFVHVASLAWSAWVHSPAIDEVAHLPAGISHWVLGRFELYAVNPPLPRMLSALPVLAMNPETPWEGYSKRIDARSEFPVGMNFVKSNGARSMMLYRVGRIPGILVSAVGMVVCMVWARRAISPRAGVAAMILFGASPGILAAAAMITPDLFAAVFGMVAWAAVCHWDRNRRLREIVTASVCVALAVLTKFTHLILIPLFLAMLAYPRAKTVRCSPAIEGSAHWSRSLLANFAGFGLILFVVVFVVNAGYAFSETGSRLGDFRFVSSTLSIPKDGDRLNRFSESSLARLPVPVPRCLVEGVDVQKRDFDRGLRSYLKGQWRDGGWWYYYLFGFLVKEPIGFQLMLGASVCHGLWHYRRWTRESIRKWFLVALPAVAIFALLSSQTGFSHHMRYLLPAYPFLFIIASRTISLGRFWKWCSYVCLTWQVAAVMWFAPHWMSYFNELAGGPRNGHKWLLDSNIDWGQDVLLLTEWLDRNPEAGQIYAALFTLFDPTDIGLNFRLAPPFRRGDYLALSPDGERGPQPGWYAISITQLRGHHFHVFDGNGNRYLSLGDYQWIYENLEPVDMIGYSIYIYHITEEDAARVRAKLLAEEAEWLRKGGSGEGKAEGGGG